jgi:hypothetical protein
MAVFAPLAAVTGLVWIGMLFADRPLENDMAPRGLTTFALTGDGMVCRWVLQGWKDGGRLPAASLELGLAFLWLCSTSTALSLACVWSSQQLPNRLWATAGIVLAWVQWVGASAGAMAGVSVSFLLGGNLQAPWPFAATLGTAVTLGLFVDGLLYASLGFVVREWARSGRFRYMTR